MLIHLEKEQEFSNLIKSGKVLVDFFATWCGPCKMLAPELEELSSTLKDLTIVKVDVDKFNSLAGSFNIRSVPTLILFENGAVSKSTSGYRDAKSLEKWVD